MGIKRWRSQNIVSKCILREVRGGVPINSLFPRCYLLTKYLSRLCIPLCDIQRDNSFATGHVLLGFTNSGEYLMSYCKESQNDGTFGIFGYKYLYTLHWWKFDLRKPLLQICHISLFGGELIPENLHLTVSNTLSDKWILVHGYAYPGRDDQCMQCYVTLCPSPPWKQLANCPQNLDSSWAVHLKYILLPPFPLFLPSIQLKITDTFLINTVDSIQAITICPYVKHSVSQANTCPCTTHCRSKSAEGDAGSFHKEETNVLDKSIIAKSPISSTRVDNELCVGVCHLEESFLTDVGKSNALEKSGKSFDHLAGTTTHVETHLNDTSISSRKSGVNGRKISCVECKNPLSLCHEEKMLPSDENTCGINKKKKESDHEGEWVDSLDSLEKSLVESSKVSHLSSFSFKTFSNKCESSEVEQNGLSLTNGSCFLDIQVTTVSNKPYKLIDDTQDVKRLKYHKFSHIHTRVVSLDVERYITEALNSSNNLKGLDWVLKNYSTLVVDVCERSRCVILHIVTLISIQATTEITKQTFSLLFTWSVNTGEVVTLSISPLSNNDGKTEQQIFKEGSKLVANLRRKYFVPSQLSSVQTLSNHNVFTRKSLDFIKHPFQPIAIVLKPTEVNYPALF